MRYEEYIKSKYKKKERSKDKAYESTSKLTAKIAKYFAIAGFILIIVGYAPSVWYVIKPYKVNVSDLILKTVQNPNKSEIAKLIEPSVEEKPYQPVYDSSLPMENRLVMPSVKIDTIINEASLDNYENALRIGVWMVANFGNPLERDKTTILAAHRFGYLKWSIPYRLKNSFYNLPKLKVGDRVEIVWEQRKYIYEVYAEGKGGEIEDYSADLILYTCESLTSPTKIFKYLRLLEI